MYEFLKDLYGQDPDGKPEALTADQLIERVEAADGLKLANLAGGEYVSKAKYEDKMSWKDKEIRERRQELEKAQKTIEALEDPEKARTAAKEWERKYNEDTAMLRKQIEAQERKHKEEMFISKYKFTSKAAREGVLMRFREEGFSFMHGQFIGAEEFMDNLKASDEYRAAFADTASTPPAGSAPEPKQKPQFSSATPTPRVKMARSMSLSEAMRYKNDHPTARVEILAGQISQD